MRHLWYHLGQAYGFALIIFVWIVWTPGCATLPEAPAVYNVIKDIRVVDTEVHLELVPSRSQNLRYTALRTANPLRLELRFSIL